MDNSAYAMLFMMLIIALTPWALAGFSCTLKHCLFKKPDKPVEPVEDEFQKRTRELAQLRQKYEANVKAHPQEQDALEQLFYTARREIIERGKEVKEVQQKSYD